MALCQAQEDLKKEKEKALTLAINSAQQRENMPDEHCVQYTARVAGPPLCGINIDYCTVSVLKDVFPIELTLRQVTFSLCCMNYPLSILPISVCVCCISLEGKYTCTSTTSATSPRCEGINSR